LNRGVRPKKQVDMIGFAVELDQFGMPLLKRFLKDRAEPFEHTLCDRLAAVFSD
jgi:hypothetical protein